MDNRAGYYFNTGKLCFHFYCSVVAYPAQLRAAALVFDVYAKLKLLGDLERRISALEGVQNHDN